MNVERKPKAIAIYVIPKTTILPNIIDLCMIHTHTHPEIEDFVTTDNKTVIHGEMFRMRYTNYNPLLDMFLWSNVYENINES